MTHDLRKKQWAFRGHADKDWKIESTLSRLFRAHAVKIREPWQQSREWQGVRKFQRAAHHFLTHLPKDSEVLDWLAVMRHYGAPTRLIDFSYSPITALFFAAGDQFRDVKKPFVVNAVHIESALRKTCAVLKRDTKHTVGPEDFRLGATQPEEDYVGFFEGRWNTPRQVAQQGLFMVTSRIKTDVDAFLNQCPRHSERDDEEPWISFEFPAGLKTHKDVTTYLLQVQQTHASLYPGIEGLAQSLCMKIYEPRSPVERTWTEE